MLHVGPNVVEGVPVEVVRKRIRRINLRVEADGTVALSVPRWWATLKMGEAFLKEKWKWVLKTREEVLSRPESTRRPVGESEAAALKPVLDDLNVYWARRLGEPGVTWKIRTLKSVWGSCHIRKRQITYNAELARAPHDLVEYVVVHELTHLQAADHGPRFYALMDARLPGWKDLRTRLNRREFIPAGPPVQADFLSQLFAREMVLLLLVSLLVHPAAALTLHRSFRTRDVGFGGGSGVSVAVPVDARIDKAIDEGRAAAAKRPRVLVGQVTHVTDGNLFRLVTGGGSVARVRLFGAIAPSGDQPFGKEAGAHLKKLILRRTVRAEFNSQDKEGNFIAAVTVGKTDVSLKMVADGFARCDTESAKLREYEQVESAARAARKGIWTATTKDVL